MTQQLKRELEQELLKELLHYNLKHSNLNNLIDNLYDLLKKYTILLENANKAQTKTILTKFKKELKEQLNNFNIEEDLNTHLQTEKEIALIQYKGKLSEDLLTASLSKISLSLKDEILGYTINELLKGANAINKKKALELMEAMADMGVNEKIFDKNYKGSVGLKEKFADINVYLSNLEGRFKTIYRTTAKVYRERIKSEIEKEMKAEGWLYVATLDSRTSPICIKHDNNFYPKKKYISREATGAVPPLHFNCRSHLVLIQDKRDRDRYLRQAISGPKHLGYEFDDFIMEHPKIAEKIIGKKKLKDILYLKDKNKDLKIKDFIYCKKNKRGVKTCGFLSQKEMVNIFLQLTNTYK